MPVYTADTSIQPTAYILKINSEPAPLFPPLIKIIAFGSYPSMKQWSCKLAIADKNHLKELFKFRPEMLDNDDSIDRYGSELTQPEAGTFTDTV